MVKIKFKKELIERGVPFKIIVKKGKKVKDIRELDKIYKRIK